MKKYTEEHTEAALKGLPIFLIGRQYKSISNGTSLFKRAQYRFTINEDITISIVEFTDRAFSGGEDYELAIINKRGDIEYGCVMDGEVLGGIIRGDDKFMDRVLDSLIDSYNRNTLVYDK